MQKLQSLHGGIEKRAKRCEAADLIRCLLQISECMNKNDQNFIAFCDELRAYVEGHHLFPDKHTRLSHKIKYTRKKINDGTLEEWKRVMFEGIAEMRDLNIHTGGRKKKITTETETNLWDKQNSEC